MATTQQRVKKSGKIAAQTEEQRDVVWRRRVGRLKRRVWGRRLVNVFVVWQIVATAVWLLPSSSPVVRLLLPPDGGGLVRAYMTRTNFAQSWQMFSPEPDGADVSFAANIQYLDGTTRLWMLPRVRDMGYVERYKRERMRKWVEVGARNTLVWPSLARYAAQQNFRDPRNPPIAVTLFLHMRAVPPPGQAARPEHVIDLCKVWMRPGDLR